MFILLNVCTIRDPTKYEMTFCLKVPMQNVSCHNYVYNLRDYNNYVLKSVLFS